MSTAPAPMMPQAKSDPWALDWTKLIPFILITVTLLAYANSFRGVFILDDHDHILNDETIRALFPIQGRFGANDRRPVVKLSLILNYTLGQFEPKGYHVVNLAIHIIAGLALFGCVRHTLWLPQFADLFGGTMERAASWLAMVCALFWLLHPLQTQAVTYIIQRSESLMGMFFLLTMYCAIRSFEPVPEELAARPVGRRWGWTILAVGFCALGMATKEVMIGAPLLVLLYDRTFVAGTFFKALRRSPFLYAALLLPYAMLLAIGFADMFSAKSNASFQSKFYTPAQYAASQAGAILYYIRLSLWPHPLCMDYFDWLPPGEGQILRQTGPAIFIMVLILLGVAWGVWKCTWWGYLGAWFFVILAPSSSFLPIRDVVMEHRMYLSLAAVIIPVVIGSWAVLRYAAMQRPELAWAVRTMAVLVCSTSLTLGLQTALRNMDYASAPTLYATSTVVRPNNPRAWRNLSAALADDKENEPDLSRRLVNALPALDRALALLPGDIDGHIARAMMYVDMKRENDAIRELRDTIKLAPSDPTVYHDLAVLLMQKDPGEAEKNFRKAIELDTKKGEPPKFPQAHSSLAMILMQSGRPKEAEEEFRTAIAVGPSGGAEGHNNLASFLMSENRIDDALVEYQAAAKAAPQSARIANNLGRAMMKIGRYADAQQAFLQAQKLAGNLEPDASAASKSNLSDLALLVGQLDVALKYAEQAMVANPLNPDYVRQKAWIRATAPAPLGDPNEALTLADIANKKTGNWQPAYLDTLAAAYAANGRFEEAAANAEKALDGAKKFHQLELAGQLPQRIAAYKSGKAWSSAVATGASK